jgi:hypothetical protein
LKEVSKLNILIKLNSKIQKPMTLMKRIKYNEKDKI